MACFWKGIQQSIIIEDFKDISDMEFVPKLSVLVQFLKDNNRATHTIRCNGEVCSKKMLEENMEAIKEYNINQINQGYYCSTADPFLFLVAFLFNVNIHHDYNGHSILYEHPNYTRTVYFHSNTSHFVYKKTIYK